jgi:hypothetical protein
MKELGEIIKAAIELLSNPKLVTVFIASGFWLFPPTRHLFPVQGAIADRVALVASVSFSVSGVYLIVSAPVWLYGQFKQWKGSPQRLLKRAIARSTPLEKLILQAVIHKGDFLIDLDAGSPISMHLQEIKLIERATGTGFAYTTYRLATGLAQLCISEPALLRRVFCSLAATPQMA